MLPSFALLRSDRRRRVRATAMRHPVSLIVIGLVLYATGPVLVQASEVSGPVFGFYRLWMGVPILGLATVINLKASGRRISAHAWRWSVWAGLFFGLHQLAFLAAVKATSVTDVALMNVLSPIVVGLVAIPLFGERTGPRFRAWSGLAMLGAGTVVLGASTGPEGNPLGMLLAGVNVLGFAGFFLISKRGRGEIDVLPFLFGVMVVAAVSVTVFVLATGAPVGSVAGRDLLLALAVAVAPGTLGHFASTWPLAQLPANLPPVLRLAQPLLSGALAAAFLAERITTAHLVGGTLTMLGVLGALRAPDQTSRRTRHAQAPRAEGPENRGGHDVRSTALR